MLHINFVRQVLCYLSESARYARTASYAYTAVVQQWPWTTPATLSQQLQHYKSAVTQIFHLIYNRSVKLKLHLFSSINSMFLTMQRELTHYHATVSKFHEFVDSFKHK